MPELLRFPGRSFQRFRHSLCVAVLALGVATCRSEESPRYWEFGEDERAPVSWSVADEDGNFYFLASVGARLGEGGGVVISMEGVELVSLDPTGVQRWALPLPGGDWDFADFGFSSPVVRAGVVWVHLAEQEIVMAVSTDGTVQGRLNDILLQTGDSLAHYLEPDYMAVGPDGTLAILPFFYTEGRTKQQQELWTVRPDGRVLWRATPMFAQKPDGPDFDYQPTQMTRAALVAADGAVFAGCTTCVSERAGLARFDAKTGTATMIDQEFAGPEKEMVFDDLRWDGASIWHQRNGQDLTTSLEHMTSVPAPELGLATTEGLIWYETSRVGSQVTFHWGTDEIKVDASYPHPLFYGFRIMAVTEPAALLLSVQEGFVLLDRKGEIIWHSKFRKIHDPTTRPLVLDGMVIYLAEHRKLVAEEVPVQRLADGPWPIGGGDLGNTRSIRP